MSEIGPGAAQYAQKTVLVHRRGSQLTVEPREFDLEDWVWVEWHFDGLQPGEFAFLSFAPPVPRFGPFNSLRSINYRSFLGKGHRSADESGSKGRSYAYQVLILSPEESEAVATGTGVIHDRATQRNTSPEIHVKYRAVKNSKGHVIDHRLDVRPDPVGLNRGDTATWVFEDLPPNAIPLLRFPSDSNPPGGPPGAGPFLAFDGSTGLQGSTVRLSAMGFGAYYQDPQTYPRFTYSIELRDWTGTVLVTHDPAIDNLGPPPPPD